ncbi:hypothetical protein KCTC52924_01476 [Arenibacter antarcticus]
MEIDRVACSGPTNLMDIHPYIKSKNAKVGLELD